MKTQEKPSGSKPEHLFGKKGMGKVGRIEERTRIGMGIQKAEAALKKGDLQEAAKLLREAVKNLEAHQKNLENTGQFSLKLKS